MRCSGGRGHGWDFFLPPPAAPAGDAAPMAPEVAPLVVVLVVPGVTPVVVPVLVMPTVPAGTRITRGLGLIERELDGHCLSTEPQPSH